MRKSIKIAIYTGSVPSTTFIERLIQGLAKNGLQIYLFGFQNRKITSISKTHYVTHSNRLSKFFILFKYSLLLRLFKSIEKRKLDKIIHNKGKNIKNLKVKYYPVLYHRPDIFHLQWAKGIEDWIWVQDFGIKLIVSLRGTHVTISPIGDDYWKDIYAQYFPKINGFHVVSKSMKSIAQEYGADSNKIKIVRSGIDIENLPFTIKTEIGTTLNIISIGRSHWTKGYTYALDAMNLLMKDNIDFNYTIVGVENKEELLYKRAQFDFDKRIIFKEKLPFEEVVKSIRLADVLLLPSIEEGIANVVIEAMALGTLVVSTNCGGMGEVIEDKVNGYLIPIRDASAIVSALKHVSELSLESYQTITNAARKTIENQHSHKKMISDMQDLYENVLNF